MRLALLLPIACALIAALWWLAGPAGTQMKHDDHKAKTELRQALAAQGPDYRPRTRHLRPDGSPIYINRLIREDSPYLLQHAHNPVDWYPWGEEAFDAARAQGKPVFLSIGYSTCHWCHVMAHESFEDEAIAAILNRHFIAIKVDREQRPDVDETYMTAVQLTLGQGGWPMSVWLTPAGKPFIGGTYFPATQFRRMLTQIAEAWRDRQPELVANADRLAQAMQRQHEALAAAGAFDLETVLAQADARLGRRHDAQLGGFSAAPKFPNESLLLYMLDRQRRAPADDRGAMLDTTLDALQRGGIHDQVGGGFHRYSTDARWQLPHFEKMLYNQALLARVFTEGHALDGNPDYAHTARMTLDYVLREMRAPGGAFYSATDADSADEHGNRREGWYFAWTPAEIRASLPAADADLAIAAFNVRDNGPFEGRNVLYLPVPLAALAADLGLRPPQLRERLDGVRAALRQVRARRPAPLRDDKLITAWNGMMIATLARAARVLGDARYGQAASEAMDDILKRHRREDGGLWRSTLHGRGSVTATQEDFAWLALALCELYDLGGERRWLQHAIRLGDRMIADFADPERGGYYMSAADPAVPLATRPRDVGDGATPSGNAIALQTLAALHARTGEPRFREQAERLLLALAGNIQRQPDAHAGLLLGASNLRRGESGLPRYLAGGHARLDLRNLRRTGAVLNGELRITLDPGWHIQAHQPNQPEYIATELQAGAGWVLERAGYPQPRAQSVAFLDRPLLLYSDQAVLTFSLRDEAQLPAALALRLQACNEALCLEPEQVTVRIPAAAD